MIERLALTNFRSHEASEILLYPGLNIFLGEVGSGKTTILEAISFAFFGKYAGNVSQSELIRRGAEKFEISLIFSTTSGRYKVDRTIYREKTQKATFWIFDGTDWNLAVTGATAISKSIEGLLDVDPTTFLAAIYASQGAIKEMLETQPGKRRERLDKLLGIDMYEKMWGSLGEVRNNVLNELTRAQETASGFSVLKEQMTDLKMRMNKKEDELAKLIEKSKELWKNLQTEEQQLKIFEDLRQRLSHLEIQVDGKNNEIRNALSALRSYREKIQQASEAEKVFEENKQFVQIAEDLEKEKRRIERALQKKESLEKLLQRDSLDLQETVKRSNKLKEQLEKLRILEESLEPLKDEKEVLPRLKEDRDNLEKKLDVAKTRTTKTFGEIENQRTKVERVANLGECPTCLQVVPADHKDRIKRETNEAITNLKSNYAVLEDARKRIATQLGNLKRQIERASLADRKYSETSVQIKMLEDCREELDDVTTKLAEIQTRIKENNETIVEMDVNNVILTEVNTKLTDASSHASKAQEAKIQMAVKKDFELMLSQEEDNLEALEKQKHEYQSRTDEFLGEYSPSQHANLENEVRRLRENLAKTLEGRERLKKSIDEDTSHVDLLEGPIEQKRKAWEQTEQLKTERDVLEILRKSLREVVQPAMRKNNVLRVSEAFLAFYQELSNDNVDYASLDEDGNVEIIRNGEPSSVNSLSGGETTCAALSLRLAICSSLTKNQLLLLDEPTIHLDELYRAKLKYFLGTHVFEQLIVVTHDDTFDSLPAHVFRVAKKKGRTNVSPLLFQGDA